MYLLAAVRSAPLSNPCPPKGCLAAFCQILDDTMYRTAKASFGLVSWSSRMVAVASPGCNQ
eukprot:13953552-Heterocapsa_arctica.AAC.1